MSEGKKTYPNRDARSHNEPIRLEKIEKDVRELKNQVEEISKEADEFINLPESTEPHAARAAGEDEEKESDLPIVLLQQRLNHYLLWKRARSVIRKLTGHSARTAFLVGLGLFVVVLAGVYGFGYLFDNLRLSNATNLAFMGVLFTWSIVWVIAFQGISERLNRPSEGSADEVERLFKKLECEREEWLDS